MPEFALKVKQDLQKEQDKHDQDDRTAVSLGGDCDTLTCIAGGIAEAFYGVPEEMKEECRRRLPENMIEILDWFDAEGGGVLYIGDF